jgi:hypothetical protein
MIPSLRQWSVAVAVVAATVLESACSLTSPSAVPAPAINQTSLDDKFNVPEGTAFWQSFQASHPFSTNRDAGDRQFVKDALALLTGNLSMYAEPLNRVDYIWVVDGFGSGFNELGALMVYDGSKVVLILTHSGIGNARGLASILGHELRHVRQLAELPSPNDAAKREEDAYHVSALIETALRLGSNQPWDPLLWEFISRSLSIRDDINPNPVYALFRGTDRNYDPALFAGVLAIYRAAENALPQATAGELNAVEFSVGNKVSPGTYDGAFRLTFSADGRPVTVQVDITMANNTVVVHTIPRVSAVH